MKPRGRWRSKSCLLASLNLRNWRDDRQLALSSLCLLPPQYPRDGGKCLVPSRVDDLHQVCLQPLGAESVGIKARLDSSKPFFKIIHYQLHIRVAHSKFFCQGEDMFCGEVSDFEARFACQAKRYGLMIAIHGGGD